MGHRVARVLAVATRVLFFLAAAFWLVTAVGLLGGVVSIGAVDRSTVNLLGVLMIAAAAVLALLGWRCLSGSRLVDAVAVTVTIVNAVTALADEAGPADVAYFGFSLVLLGTLVATILARRSANRGRSTPDGLECR